MDDATTKEKKYTEDTNNVDIMPVKPIPYQLIDVFGLNDDCIRQVCEYLDLPDLYNMSVASEELKTKVVQSAIRGRMITFSKLADCCHIVHVFKLFGCAMTKIEISEKDIQYKERKFSKFDEILRLISTYCRKDTLRHLTLQYIHGSTIADHFLSVSIPFFRCIESLTIKETDSKGLDTCIDYFECYPSFNTSVNDFLERVVTHAPRINSLQLYNMKITGHFFHLDHISKLKTLSLYGCNVRMPKTFLTFLQENQHLSSFTWENSSLFGLDTDSSHSSNLVYELVTSRLNHLKAFSYYPNEGFIDDENKYNNEFHFEMPDYDHLSKFRNLKELSVPGISLTCLRLLTHQNTVEKLFTLFSDVSSEDGEQNLNFLSNFTSLNCIQLFFPLDEKTKSFNKLLLSELSRLTQYIIHFDQIDKEILGGQFSVSLYNNLLEIRLRQESVTHPLVIFLENELIAEFDKGTNYRPDIVDVRVHN
ncbi:hypothetical protein Bhyg_16559 [Pseudolycoriella hygida]|uniref:F-box domain-containing protein n=1 Tax=Pseudolycoriella hygida TaxID=35572 RepID=A0A9Q0MKV8_9DIPT|nr:hypothetical protein Bhyg_16559 [Pseudolycoriella hygida]